MQRRATGSEGEAYRYVKKVLISYSNENPDFIQSFGKHITDCASKYMVSEFRAFFMEIRRLFFRNDVGDIYFAPAVARIAISLNFHTNSPNFRSLDNLVYIVNMISTAHKAEYDRNLNGLSYNELNERYGTVVRENWEEIKKLLSTMHYGPRRYKIIHLDSFDIASQYKQYTEPHTWCHFAYKEMFESYSHNGCVDLYLAVLPGFETMTENDPLYGESMLGIDIGYQGKLIHVNNRWNHDRDDVDSRKGDNKYNEIELSELLGGPFYEICPSSLNVDADALRMKIYQDVHKKTQLYTDFANSLKDAVDRVRHVKVMRQCWGDQKYYFDGRNHERYPILDICGTEWLARPLRYIPDENNYGRINQTFDIEICRRTDVTQGTNGCYVDYTGSDTNTFVPYTSYMGYRYHFDNCVTTDMPEVLFAIGGGMPGDDTVLYSGDVAKYIPDDLRVPTLEEYAQLFAVCGGHTVEIEDDSDKMLLAEERKVAEKFDAMLGIRPDGWYISGYEGYEWNLKLNYDFASENWMELGGSRRMFCEESVSARVYDSNDRWANEMYGSSHGVAKNLFRGYFFSKPVDAPYHTDIRGVREPNLIRVGPFGIRATFGHNALYTFSPAMHHHAPLFLVRKKPTDGELTICASID